MSHRLDGRAKFFVPQSLVGDYPAFELGPFVIVWDGQVPLKSLDRNTRLRWESEDRETTRYFSAIQIGNCDGSCAFSGVHTHVQVKEELSTCDELMKRENEIKERRSNLTEGRPLEDTSDHGDELELLRMEQDDIARMRRKKRC